MTGTIVFCVQDRTGTVAQLTLEDATPQEIMVGDTGVYTGYDFNGEQQEMDFTINQVLDDLDFGITTQTADGAPGTMIQVGWPKKGTITWMTGENSSTSPNTTVVVDENPANAYCTVDFFAGYCQSRGYTYPSSPEDAIQQAIVQSSEYLDQRYHFKGTKLFQFLADNPFYDPAFAFIDPWLANFGWFGGTGMGPGTNFIGLFSPAWTIQHTEWPRNGCVDRNGDNVYGVPLVIQQATCEGTVRLLNGYYGGLQAGGGLQPDYDPSVVKPGAVVSEQQEEVGPIRRRRSFDTKLGLSFFPSVPHIDRMLRAAGILVAGGGRRPVL